MLTAAFILSAALAATQAQAAPPQVPRPPVAMRSDASVRVVRAEKITFASVEPAERQEIRRKVARDGRRLIEFL